MRLRSLASAAAGLILGLGAQAKAVEIAISCSALGQEYEICKQGVDAWAKKTGNTVKIVSTPNSATERLALYQQLLAAGAGDVDVFQIDVVWPGILGRHLVDLTPKAQAQLAPAFPGDDPEQHRRRQARRDAVVRRCGAPLLPQGPAREVQPAPVPQTWEDLTETAQPSRRASARRAERDFWGFVWQGRAYEGLTDERPRMDGLAWRRHDRRRQGRDHDQQPEGDRGPEGRGRLGRQDQPAGRAQLHRGGGPRRLPGRQCGLHAQLALCLGARPRRRQSGQGQGRHRAAAEGRRRRRRTPRRSAASCSRSRNTRRTRTSRSTSSCI